MARPLGRNVKAVEAFGCVGAHGIVVGEEGLHQRRDAGRKVLHDGGVLELTSGRQQAQALVGGRQAEPVVLRPGLGVELGDGLKGRVRAYSSRRPWRAFSAAVSAAWRLTVRHAPTLRVAMTALADKRDAMGDAVMVMWISGFCCCCC